MGACCAAPEGRKDPEKELEHYSPRTQLTPRAPVTPKTPRTPK